MFDLTDKTALITGATGGIGMAIAKEMKARGAKLILSGTKKDILDKLVANLGKDVKGIIADIGDKDSIASMAKEAENYFGSVDILVNNAGITIDGLLMRMKDEDWDNVLNVNLKANFSLCKMVVKGMVKKRWGRIINISSAVAKMGNAGQTNYAASKAAIEGLTRSLSLEVASRGITVNAVAPGFIGTEILESIDPKKLEDMAKNIPVGRIGDVTDISNIVSFLASDESSYITGQVLHVNGGLTL